MCKEPSGEARLYGCQTNFLVAFPDVMESQASTGQLLPGSSSISSHPIAGTAEWVRVSCLREHRTQRDSDVPLAYAKACTDACIHDL